MLILGIETSCDETAAAVVKDGREIISNVVFSQIALHQATGGVVPEVAAREHVVKIAPVIKEAFAKAGIAPEDMDAVAVTAGPGLLSSLLIGVNAAMTLAMVYKKPLVPVNHVEGHIYANWILKAKGSRLFSEDIFKEAERVACYERPTATCGGGAALLCLKRTACSPQNPQFPLVVLTASGGHNELILMRGHGDYKFLGATLDDAAGEAFDKVARLLGLGYPGGPAIEAAAKNGDPKRYALPRAWVTGYDFSFSGLKTAVLYLLRDVIAREHKRPKQSIRESSRLLRPAKAGLAMTKPSPLTSDVAASFQDAVCEVLATKLVRAAQEFKAQEIHLAGGVSANQRLRWWVNNLCKTLDPHPSTLYPPLPLCTDNAAMIAAAGYFKYKKSPARYKTWAPINPDPNLEIKNW